MGLSGVLCVGLAVLHRGWLSVCVRVWVCLSLCLSLCVSRCVFLPVCVCVPGCAGCGRDIKNGQALLALDTQWHLGCFRCRACSKVLSGEYISKWVLTHTDIHTLAQIHKYTLLNHSPLSLFLSLSLPPSLPSGMVPPTVREITSSTSGCSVTRVVSSSQARSWR